MIGLLLTLGLVVVGYAVGMARESRHLHDLVDRERAIRAQLLITQLPEPPPGTDARLVTGEAVMATDYFKQVALGLRSIVGGESRAYRPVMERARRQALVRAAESAVAAGANQLVNVRFETSLITPKAVEVLCFGTAVRTMAPR